MNTKEPKVGMGITICGHSDRSVYTIVRVSPSGKTFWATADECTLDPNWKPDFVPGGFAGHVTNNSEQKYTYKTAPNDANRLAFRLRKNGLWNNKHVGDKVIFDVRRAFYDYNF